MAKRYNAVRSPDDFPKPAAFGIWRPKRSSFTLHDNLSLAKSAMTNETRSWNDTFATDYEVYEWVEGEWCHIYSMTEGTARKQHTLWLAPAPKTAGISVTATDKAVAEAIASLTNQE